MYFLSNLEKSNVHSFDSDLVMISNVISKCLSLKISAGLNRTVAVPQPPTSKPENNTYCVKFHSKK